MTNQIQDRFTPEPWEAELSDEEYFPGVYLGPRLPYADNSGYYRARISINDGPTPEQVNKGHAGGTTMATCNANALLIAAAPGLLKACEEMLIELRAYNAEDEYDQTSLLYPSFQSLKTAIAKAKGVSTDAI